MVASSISCYLNDLVQFAQAKKFKMTDNCCVFNSSLVLTGPKLCWSWVVWIGR